MEKSLYAAPVGLSELAAGPEIEIELELEPIDGEDEIVEETKAEKDSFDENLAESMDESDLQSLGEDLIADFEKDIGDRKEWMQTYVEGLKL